MDEFFARNRLSAYLDGELTTAEQREVEDALSRSPELRAELDDLRAGIALLRSGGPVPAPRDFARRLDARLATEPMQVGWARHLRRVRGEAVLLAAAAALVLVFVGKRPSEPVPDAATEQVVTKDDAVAQAPTAGTEAPPPVAPVAPAVDAAGMPGTEPSADGVLGGEAPQKAELARKSEPKLESVKAKQQSFAGTKKSKTAFEKEAYVPAWEQQEAPTTPTVQVPARYRLTIADERGLFALDTIVRGYGGRLEDERGRPIAPYALESGDSRRVRLALPAGTVSAGQLYDRLKALGHAELIQADTMYGGGNAPIVVEVSRE